MTAALSPLMWGLLIFTPAIIALGQVVFKISADKVAASGAPFHMVVIDPYFLVGVAMYGGATVMWMYVLRTAPLSFAYSFMALAYLMVPIFSWFWLGETLSLKYFIGTLVIIAGILIVQN